MPKITIESDEPCLVLVMPLPRRVEPLRAPRRVIETTGTEVPSRPGVARAVAPVVQMRRVGSR